ncbi:hypothetical protein BU24DRAFT_393146 [Aaosphaeria arxii CBS 175.79]|uniref:Uncharacterized protein n=1 Tax=Aaosphaeria arxii CBS 175.79 TaxID=1450172 RepID=A0A6A5XQA1_9PLEO|nr:uncharacterized protein BU24DRAFT_393146 [Aaosphaeria arxii CBS 175.79]KAF2014910.1 hypothetical protein BU24DRAFT_393146 [Aaosphaeria arxii CBS 175.79]
MNNFSSFLDTSNPISNNMPRQPPTPSPPQSGVPPHSNGMGGQTNGVPLVNGLPSGGQQTDMNHLWNVVQQLSQVLEENRQQTLGIVNGVQAIQQRASEEGGIGNMSLNQVNGELNAASRTAEIQTLNTQLSSAQTQINSLTDSNNALTNLITDYENAITVLLEKLRPYAFNQTQAILSLHKHYQGLLEQERATSMQVRLEHAEWQAGLGRVAEYARLALKVQNEDEMPYKREIKELKEENRVLRRLAGWEAKADDSSDEEGEENRIQ